MKNINNHLISQNLTIREALVKLNSLRDGNLTLFVVSENNKIEGTLTDGDIRRAFLNGATLKCSISKYMFTNFSFLKENKIDIQTIKKARKRGIKLLPLINKSENITDIYDLKKIKSILPVDAVIMAGGLGKRLLPLTADTPKPMLLLGNKPIIEHNINRLISFGIKNIYISVSYLAEQIENYFGDGSKKGISIKYIYEDKPLGTIGAVRNVENYSNNDILIMNSDLFTNINFEHFYLDHKKENAAMTIASTPYTVNIPYAIFKTKENKVLSFKEKPINTHYANAGIYLLKRELLTEIPKNKFFNTTDLMNKLLEQNKKLIHSPIFGYWIDIGQHGDYKKAKEIIKNMP